MLSMHDKILYRKIPTLFAFLLLAVFLNGFVAINSTLSVGANRQSEIETNIDMSRMMQTNYMFGMGVMIDNAAIMTKAASAFGNYDQCNPTGLGMVTCNTSFAPKSGFVAEEYSLFKKYMLVDVLAFDRQFGKWQKQRREGIQKSKKTSKVNSFGGSWTLTVAMPYPIAKINDNKVTYTKDPNSITIDLEEEFVTAESVLIESETDNIYGIVITGAIGLLLIFVLITGILIKQRKTITVSILLLTVYAVLILLELDGQIRLTVNGFDKSDTKSHQEKAINTQETEYPVQHNVEEVKEIPKDNFYFTQNSTITDNEYSELKKISSEYASSEMKMIQTYSKLKKSLPNDAIGLLENDQNRWLNERNQGALNAGSKGSNEYLAELIRLTKERTKELREQL